MRPGSGRTHRRRTLALTFPQWPDVANRVAAELHRRADVPGAEGLVADSLLRILHRSAHLMTEAGSQLEQALTPPRAPRARRSPSRKAGAAPARVRKLRPDD